MQPSLVRSDQSLSFKLPDVDSSPELTEQEGPPVLMSSRALGIRKMVWAASPTDAARRTRPLPIARHTCWLQPVDIK